MVVGRKLAANSPAKVNWMLWRGWMGTSAERSRVCQRPTVEKREEFAKLDEGWFYDARDRRGVLRVKTKSIALTAGFAVKITL